MKTVAESLTISVKVEYSDYPPPERKQVLRKNRLSGIVLNAGLTIND